MIIITVYLQAFNMFYLSCLFSLITINLVNSAEINPRHTIMEILDTQLIPVPPHHKPIAYMPAASARSDQWMHIVSRRHLKWKLSKACDTFTTFWGEYQECFNRLISTEQKREKVDVQLIYECRCGYCIKFHKGFFNETVTKLAGYVDLKTYPYGNAVRKEENGKTVIECQHGPDECYGNKLHACAIDVLKNNTLSVFYNSCMMYGPSTDKDAIRCGELMGIDSKSIMECAKSKRGEDLLEYYGKETDKYAPDKAGVPWPLINGKVYLGEHEDFMRTICAALANPPPECNEL